ncbi:hypothetical protein TL16_g11142 [Triparma laevis f. inornata]|uniref:Uncharacterized protein n=1 Tax=Triparma laevis f. inornata TaxID=1714386 RepID=A0A9W7BLI3_9STRA|nr:hypothetical protein TL16_g11142 [Triparma laevis f. inornata]
MSLSLFFTVVLSKVLPYNESRDNWIAILSSALLIVVFLSASFMKHIQVLAEESQAHDLVGMDVLLIVAYRSVIVLFLWWLYHQKEEMPTSTATVAKNTLKGKSSAGGSSLADVEGIEDEDEEKGERKPKAKKTKKPEVKKSHLVRAETFKEEYKAKGGGGRVVEAWK